MTGLNPEDSESKFFNEKVFQIVNPEDQKRNEDNENSLDKSFMDDMEAVIPEESQLVSLWEIYKILRARVTPPGQEFIPLSVKTFHQSQNKETETGETTTGTTEAKTLQVCIQNLTYENEECALMIFVDMTHVKKVVHLELQNLKIQLRESSVTHELIAPLRCIIKFAEELIEQYAAEKRKCEIPKLIFNTAKLIHAQMNDILDNHMLGRRSVVANKLMTDLKDLVYETVNIFKA